jgi:outer membrane lipoprotein-sorting protein
MRTRAAVLLLMVSLGGARLSAQEAELPAGLTGDQVMEHLARAFEPVTDFSVSLEVEVNLDRLQVPGMKATLYFKRPNKIFLESPGFAMMPREGMVVNPDILRQQYEARVEGNEKVNGSEMLGLRLVARDVTAGRRQILLWVDPANWTITRTESVPYEGRSVETKFVYAHVDGRYWLPEKMTMVLKAEAADSSSLGLMGETPGAQPLTEMRRAPRNGTVTVQYTDYHVNVGLSDELFQTRGKD